MQIFLAPERGEATVGLLIGFISILSCLRPEGRGRGGGLGAAGRLVGGAVGTHTAVLDEVRRLTRTRLVAPKNN